MAYEEAERDRMYLRGLLPPAVFTQDVQADKVMINIRSMANDLEKHNYYLSYLKARSHAHGPHRDKEWDAAQWAAH